MKIISKQISEINIMEYNPRIDLKPGDPAYEKIKSSILEYKLVEPLVWNEKTGNLVGGHQRLRVLQDLGYTDVEVSVVTLDEEAEKKLNLALNKIAGDWDKDKLQRLIGDLENDLEVTGFTSDEIEQIIKAKTPSDINDILEDLDIETAIERPIWIVIRGNEQFQSELNSLLEIAEQRGFRIETNYDR